MGSPDSGDGHGSCAFDRPPGARCRRSGVRDVATAGCGAVQGQRVLGDPLDGPRAETGGVDPRPRGGRSRSPLEPHASWLLNLIVLEPDLTLAELERRIAEGVGVTITERSIRRFFDRHRISFKKTAHASEQDRPDVAEARERWRLAQASLDPAKLVFVDETGTSTKMTRLRGRCLRGRRLIGKAPGDTGRPRPSWPA